MMRKKITTSLEISVCGKDIVFNFVILLLIPWHHPSSLIFSNPSLKEIGLALKRDGLHPVKGIANIKQTNSRLKLNCALEDQGDGKNTFVYAVTEYHLWAHVRDREGIGWQSEFFLCLRVKTKKPNYFIILHILSVLIEFVKTIRTHLLQRIGGEGKERSQSSHGFEMFGTEKVQLASSSEYSSSLIWGKMLSIRK